MLAALAVIAAARFVLAVASAPICVLRLPVASTAALTAAVIAAALPELSAVFSWLRAFCAARIAAARFSSAVTAALRAVVRLTSFWPVTVPAATRVSAVVIVPAIWVSAFVPLEIASVRAFDSPSCIDPPTETVPVLFAVLVPFAVLEAFPVFEPALLAELVPVLFEPLTLCEPVPVWDPPAALLFSVVPALLAEFVPLAEPPLPLLFEPVPDFEPPFFVFEPVWLVFMSWPDWGLPPPLE